VTVVIAAPRVGLGGREECRQGRGDGDEEHLSQHDQSPCQRTDLWLHSSLSGSARSIRARDFCHGVRFRVTAWLSGIGLPSTFRSLPCNVSVFSSTRVRMNVDVPFFASGKTVLTLILHLLPSRVQEPSAKAPLESNIHARMF